MIFDALRRIVDNWLNDIQPLAEAATLIHLPVTPHKVLPREQDLETMSDVSINFRLPHRITAIEDNASCVLLIDQKPDLVGLHEERMFIECVPLARMRRITTTLRRIMPSWLRSKLPPAMASME
jgi:hypothetical protein